MERIVVTGQAVHEFFYLMGVAQEKKSFPLCEEVIHAMVEMPVTAIEMIPTPIENIHTS
jgi:hypothetical protein